MLTALWEHILQQHAFTDPPHSLQCLNIDSIAKISLRERLPLFRTSALPRGSLFGLSNNINKSFAAAAAAAAPSLLPSRQEPKPTAMQTPGLSYVPLTRLLLLLLPLLAIITTSTALKPYVPISPFPHLYPWLQFHRLATYQLVYLSSSEVLFSCVLIYQLRVLERLFGTRKYLSAILVVFVWQAICATALTSLLQILTWGNWAYLPGGMTGVVCALVAMWREAVPATWRWRLSIGGGGGSEGTSRTGGNNNNSNNKGVMFSDKSTTYLFAAQLALAQFPYSIVPAVVGWVLGSLWRAEVLPGSGWRVPGWVVGESGEGLWGAGARGKRREFEGLRRRLEDEGRAERERDMGVGVASGSTVAREDGSGEGRRRGVLRQVGDFFRGAI